MSSAPGEEVVWPWGMSDRDPDPSDRPWVFNPKGFVLIVLDDDAEAARAAARLQEVGFAKGHLRTYSGAQVLEDRKRFVARQSLARRVVESVTIDSEAVDRLLGYAEDGRAFLWAVAPTRDDANRAIRNLYDHRVRFVRYYGDRGVEDIVMP